MSIVNRPNAEYKVTFTTTVKTDSGRDIDLEDIQSAVRSTCEWRYYEKPSDLAARAEWTVEEIVPVDPEGTIRRYITTGNCAIKRGGAWIYIKLQESAKNPAWLGLEVPSEEYLLNNSEVVTVL